MATEKHTDSEVLGLLRQIQADVQAAMDHLDRAAYPDQHNGVRSIMGEVHQARALLAGLLA
jgi:hypothetical protein